MAAWGSIQTILMRCLIGCCLLASFAGECHNEEPWEMDEKGERRWSHGNERGGFNRSQLQLVSLQLGSFGVEERWIYVEPPIETFYRQHSTEQRYSQAKATPASLARHCKFVNTLRQTVGLYWDKRYNGTVELILVKQLRPFSTAGITAFVGSRFSFRLDLGEDLLVIQRFQVTNTSSLLFSMDPISEQTDRAVQYVMSKPIVNETERMAYDILQKTIAFNRVYYNVTGRTYLSTYGRKPPIHHMWPADYFGQMHTVTSRWGHALSVPVSTDESPGLPPHSSFSNFTLKVVSCAPRVYEIEGFLSEIEVQHILDLAAHKHLMHSKTGNGDGESSNQQGAGTRTSQNTWLGREESPLIELLYRRTADVLKIPQLAWTQNVSLGEPLQLVRYQKGEEYKAHCDFGYADPTHPDQPTRFATLLLYLNDVPQGGETAFPLWSTADIGERLTIKPKVGNAALFYQQLPDGNMDELSLHEALPVEQGEKFLANMWIWDPYRDEISLQ